MQDDDDLPPEDTAVSHEAAASAVDRRSNAKKKKRDIDEQIEAAVFWSTVLADRVGQRELWKLFQAGHIFETIFSVGPTGFPQPEATWFKAGEQDFARRFYQLLERIDPAGVLAMHQAFDSTFAKPVPRRVKDD